MNGRLTIWITWEHQTRNRSLSSLLDIPLYEIVSERKGLQRYGESLLKTFQLIRAEKPDVLFCQNPSIVLSFFCVLLRRHLSFKVIVDEHNAGLFPFDGENRFLNWIARYIVRNANGIIVTNEPLAQQCTRWGGMPIVIEDPLPDFTQDYSIAPPATRSVAEQERKPFELMFICTWASDEPYANALMAAREFSAETLRMTITGNPKGKVDTSEIPDSVYLAGFLSKTDYVNQLANADGVLVLTTREDCLNCGAYEAVSMLKPGILSDTSALRYYFSGGFVFTDNSMQSLIQSIRFLISERDSLQKEITRLKINCERNDQTNHQKVMNFLVELV
jgi:glycosyltransferase involved in cell wall biosynthesis